MKKKIILSTVLQKAATSFSVVILRSFLRCLLLLLIILLPILASATIWEARVSAAISSWIPAPLLIVYYLLWLLFIWIDVVDSLVVALLFCCCVFWLCCTFFGQCERESRLLIILLSVMNVVLLAKIVKYIFWRWYFPRRCSE